VCVCVSVCVCVYVCVCVCMCSSVFLELHCDLHAFLSGNKDGVHGRAKFQKALQLPQRFVVPVNIVSHLNLLAFFLGNKVARMMCGTAICHQAFCYSAVLSVIVSLTYLCGPHALLPGNKSRENGFIL